MNTYRVDVIAILCNWVSLALRRPVPSFHGSRTPSVCASVRASKTGLSLNLVQCGHPARVSFGSRRALVTQRASRARVLNYQTVCAVAMTLCRGRKVCFGTSTQARFVRVGLTRQLRTAPDIAIAHGSAL